MSSSSPTIQVAIPLPLTSTFTYRWPDDLPERPCVGRRVLVPFGKRRLAGYVVEIHPVQHAPIADQRRRFACKDVLAVLDEEPLFDPEDLRLYRWLSDYYLAALGETLRTAIPVSMHLRSSRAVRLLPPGFLALKQGLFLERKELEILAFLEEAGGKRSWKSLQQRWGRGLPRWIEPLEKQGLLERCERVQGLGKGKRPAEILVCSTLSTGDPSVPAFLELLPPEESRFLRVLLDRGPCLKSDLDSPDQDAGPALSGLLDKGLVRLRRPEGVATESVSFEATPAARPTLTDQQQEAVRRILPFLDPPAYQPFLLHGVTGSGKTEIYMTLIEAALRRGRDALVLVPEIGLTPQIVKRFQSRFGSHVAVLHSGVLESERMEWWWKIRRGLVKIAIGTRSAVFAPFRNLGVIVVDEEHDPSYKQQDRLRYHARDVALVRGQQLRAVVVLGSATPSLESYYNARSGKSTLLELTDRVEGQPLPPITCVDIRDRNNQRNVRDAVSVPLERALKENLASGKKTLLFLNRRGYAPTVICYGCGHLFRCPHCSVTLTFHRSRNRVCCHYCDHQADRPSQCPACGAASIEPVGRGTERVEEEIRALLPAARVGRMDRDTTRKRGDHARLLECLRGEGLDILIGTQMITKGHDIPDITLVGVVLADVSLDLPDFRASERTYQLLLQVAGRAGRGAWPGQVLVQTRHPDHYCLRALGSHDYKQFYEQEIAFRRELHYPPVSRMVNLRVSGSDERKTGLAAARLGDEARAVLREAAFQGAAIEILGPSRAPLAKLRGRFRHQCFLKGGPPRLLLALARRVADRAGPFLERNKVQLEVDVDPVQVL